MRRAWSVLFAVVLLAGFVSRFVPDAAAASIFENVGLISSVDPSVRSWGMSGASGAVNWADDPDTWANPAMLGLVNGLKYTGGRGKLADETFTNHVSQWTLGYGGLGLSLVGQPFDGLGKLEIETPFTLTTAYAPEGFTTTWITRERSWGVGASLAGLATTLAGRGHRDAPAFTRHLDLAVGYSQKVVQEGFSNDLASGAHGTADDAGVLLSAHTTFARGGGDAAPLRLDGAYGFSAQNLGPGWLTGKESRAPMPRELRNAFSARAALGMPGAWRRAAPAWMAPALRSMVSLGLAFDAEHSNFYLDQKHYGAELGLTRVLALQIGYRHSPGYTSPTTWGYTIMLPFGDIAGVRYSYASVPGPSGIFDKPNRYDSGSVWLDPVALWRAKR